MLVDLVAGTAEKRVLPSRATAKGEFPPHCCQPMAIALLDQEIHVNGGAGLKSAARLLCWLRAGKFPLR